MSNVFEEIGHGIEVAAKDTGEAILWPFKHTAEAVAALTAAIKDEPSVRASIIGLVAKAEAVDADAVAAIGSKGADITSDLATMAAVKDFFIYFESTFVPAVKAAYADIEQASK